MRVGFGRGDSRLAGIADAAGEDGASALGRADQEEATRVEALGNAGKGVAFFNTNPFAANPGRTLFEAGANALGGGLDRGLGIGAGEGGDFAIERL